jgi:hypothetical protein
VIEDASTEATHSDSVNPMFFGLFSFLNEKEVNPVLSGYFSKIMMNLIQKKPKEIGKFIFSRPNIWQKLIEHCYSPAVNEVLSKILTDDPINGELEDEFKDVKGNIAKMLIEKLEPTNFEDLSIGCCKLLIDHLSNPIIGDMLKKPETFERLKEQILNGNGVSLRCALRILIQLIEYEKKKFTEIDAKDQVANKMIGLIRPLINMLSKSLEVSKSAWTSQNGATVQSFGMANQRIIEFFDCLIKLHFPVILAELSKCCLFSLLLKIVSKYYDNSCLHNLVFGILNYALKEPNELLCDEIIIKSDVPKILIEMNQDAEIKKVTESKKEIKYVKPYNIHVLELSNNISNTAETNPNLKKCLENIPEWLNFKVKGLGPYKIMKEETLYGNSKFSEEPQFECDFGSIALKFEKNKDKLSSSYNINIAILRMITRTARKKHSKIH